jgi:cysteine desulfurase
MPLAAAVTRQEIYLDCAATTPVDPAVVEAMVHCLGGEHANPSSAHAAGQRARRLVETARERIAERVQAAPQSILFTSGATEANNLALKGAVTGHARLRPHFVTSRIEHKSVLDAARALEEQGLRATYVDCDEHGAVTPQSVAEAMTDDTVLVSVMHVNNETGVVQDIAAIAEHCRARGVLLHVDAAQSAGKLPLLLGQWGVDLCSLASHKLHGPKGIGALYVRNGVAIAPQMHGGEQEQGLRAGTLATHQIVGMGKAYELADPQREAPLLAALRDRLASALGRLPGVRVNGAGARRAPHILNVSFAGVEGESLRLAVSDLAVSAGSACNSDSPEASHVLSAMGLSDALAASSLRFSVGRFTRAAEIDRAAHRLEVELERLRALSESAPAWCSRELLR